MESKSTCQICERVIKANTGVIAHHGYQRPGDGWQTESCMGARHLPYEVSCDAIQPCIDHIRNWLGMRKAFLKDFIENPPETILRPSAYRPPVVLNRPEGFDAIANDQKGSWSGGYDYEHHARCSQTRYDIRDAESTILRLEKRLRDWKAI